MPSYETFRSYVTEKDFEILAAFTKKKPYAIVLRKCDEDVINRLADGSGGKPSDILSKTIKNTIKPEWKCLKGLLGYWHGADLMGVYLTGYGARMLASSRYVKHITDTHKPVRYYFSVFAGGIKALNILLRYKHNVKYFFTDSYQLHACVRKTTIWQHIEANSPGQTRFFADLNKVLINTPATAIEPETPDYRHIQINSQYGHIAYLLSYETQPVTINKVIETAQSVYRLYPMALCFGGEWRIVNNDENYKSFLESLKLTPNDNILSNLYATLKRMYANKIQFI